MLPNKENLLGQSHGDRFIPSQIRSCAFNMENNIYEQESYSNNYEELLSKSILAPSHSKNINKIMNFSCKPDLENQKGSQYKSIQSCEKKPRKIKKKPFKILEAPNLQDDFYLNLLDWSDNNQIAVALDSSLYLWSGCSSEVTKIY